MSPTRHGVRVRHLSDDDWDAVVALEFHTYDPAGLSEGRAALESRVRASPSTCFVLHLEGRLAGYALALPYPESAYPELAGTDETAFESSNLHLHDLVIAEHLRGRGLGRHLLRHLSATAAAHGFERMSLVAVGGSDTFWAGNGFTAHQGIVPSGSYGADAVYMSRTVVAGRAQAVDGTATAGMTATAGRAVAGAVTVTLDRTPAAARGGGQEARAVRVPAPVPGAGKPHAANMSAPRGSSTHRQKG
ncbi:GNAT family N-acetyltransferase [Streptomyces sp. NBC_01497]|uniref:GNAT family N-acetyltransferase n=1 Tax=Streptomyces sp. NBC_01497 TaxID=2903885 RepID=UPI002E31F972|nr:GNAT family N-acetyltransferase [Streptomyces sp. NBC_01497]